MAACGTTSTSSPESAQEAASGTAAEASDRWSSSAGAESPAEPVADVSLVVPRARDVLGEWEVVSVLGHSPPDNALKGLTMARADRKFWAGWTDGVNLHSVSWTLTPAGDYKSHGEIQTLVGCEVVDDPDDPTRSLEHLLTGGPVDGATAEGSTGCEQPSGFGASGASSLRLTADGDLFFLAGDGSELARYARAH